MNIGLKQIVHTLALNVTQGVLLSVGPVKRDFTLIYSTSETVMFQPITVKDVRYLIVLTVNKMKGKPPHNVLNVQMVTFWQMVNANKKA